MHDPAVEIQKAIIPVAGYGTRRLPITKSIEKCMLPVCNRPIVDYTVEACIAAGIKEIIFVVGQEHDQLKSYYQANQNLETYLEERGRTGELALVKNYNQPISIDYLVQDPTGPYGTAVPVWLARGRIVPGEKFLVLTGDDFIYNPADPGKSLRNLVGSVSSSGAPAGLLATEVNSQNISRYAAIETKTEDDQEWFIRLHEKPDPGSAPGNLANISKYLLDADIFPFIKDIMYQPNQSGEHYLTDAVNAYAAAGNRLAVVRAEGTYLDGGNLDGWIRANNVVYDSL